MAEAGGIPPRIQSCLSRAVHELLHPGWVTQAMVNIITVLLGPAIAERTRVAADPWVATPLSTRWEIRARRPLLICVFVLIPFTGAVHIHWRPLGVL